MSLKRKTKVVEGVEHFFKTKYNFQLVVAKLNVFMPKQNI
jgi:hypothetical protein